MRKVFAKGLDTVFVVGENGLIARSPDRALTWQKQHPVATQLNDIVFSDSSTGFAVGNGGVILKTANAGDSWTLLASGTTKNINALAVTDGGDVWAVGDNNLVLRSTDKGSSWQQIDVLSGKKRLLDVKFNGSLGYISGEEGTITKTLDKGETWHSQAFDVSQSIHSFCFTSGKTFALQFYNGMPAYGTIITSVDNEHWTIPIGEYLGPNFVVGSIYFIDSFRGFYGSYSRTTGNGFGLGIYSTDDGGETWAETDISRVYGDISEESNFSFSDDGSIGYFLCGQILLRTPYNGEFGGIKNQAASKTILNQTGNILHASNSIEEVSSVRIVSISGKLYAKASGSTVDVSALPRGMYLVEISFADDRTEAQKWIKK
jgi:photosystem II stability/assembly factor-like uncharacterized protein